MSPWDRSWPRSGPKKPPPEHGIKMKKAGTTWWGQRWIEALERVLRGDAGRLARGKTYARAGRTHDLVVRGGTIGAKVTGSRATPYEVNIELAQLSDSVWQRAIAAMADKAQFAAELLAGQMPLAIDDVFRDAGTSLFPEQRAELVTACSCPDWGDPCKHVAATHYLLGEALDQDPFLLFELRGRSKARVLGGIRAARQATSTDHLPRDAASDDAARAEETAATVDLGAIDAADYERAPQVLPALDFSFEAPAARAAVLRQLGAPASWRADESPADLLAPLVQRAAEMARQIALAEEPAVERRADAGTPALDPAVPSSAIGGRAIEPRPRRTKMAKKKRRTRRSPEPGQSKAPRRSPRKPG
jgi:uncharacterized Zn finger protein